MESSRFYENQFPEVGDVVVVNVIELESNMGAYVSLLEYNGLEGLILPTELSKRRFRSIHKLIKVGRQEIVMVIRIDKEKGYVDLSKKRVSPEDISMAEKRFAKSKKVALTARQTAHKLDRPVEEINKLAIWPLYAKYGHAYEGLRIAVENKAEAFSGIECPPQIIDAIVEDMAPRLAPRSVRVRVRTHVGCTSYEGVHAIRHSLLAVENKYADYPKEKFELKVKLIAAPLYSLVATASDKASGLENMQEALAFLSKTILSIEGGEFKQHGDIVVTSTDDNDETGTDGDTSDEDISASSDSEEESNIEDEEKSSTTEREPC